MCQWPLSGALSGPVRTERVQSTVRRVWAVYADVSDRKWSGHTELQLIRRGLTQLSTERVEVRLREQAFAKCPGNCLRSRVHVQFFIDRAQMKADGVDADPHGCGSGFILMALGEQLQQANFLR
jgi:hypothetical protein